MRWATGAAIGLLIGGCGRLQFDPLDDGGADASVDAACALGPWSTPARVTELSSALNDYRAALTADGLTVIIQSNRAGTLGGYDLWMSTRPTPTAAFTTPVNLVALNTTSDDGGATFSRDGLTLYFHSDRTGENHVYRSTRPTPTAAFSAATIEPGLTTTTALGPDLSADGNELYFTQVVPTQRILRALPSGATWVLDTAIAEFLPDDNGFSSTSGDGRRIYFGSGRAPSVTEDIWMAERTGPGSPYNAPVLVTEFSTDISGDEDPMISKDDRTMMWSSDRDGSAGVDIFSATRSCL